MAFCKKCGKELENDAEFCTNCGTPVTKTNEERTIVYEGDIHKCPNCGEILQSFYTNCPSCGYEIRNRDSSTSIKEFTRKLEEIEKERASSKGVSVFAQAFGNISKIDEKKINLIRNFSIPNTKEAIFEFIILAASNVDLHSYENGNELLKRTISNAWLAKMEQAYQKAIISFGNAPEFDNVRRIYEEKMKGITKAKSKKNVSLILCIALPLIISLCLIVFGISMSSSENRDEQLKTIVRQIEYDIRQGDYTSAKNKAYTLTYDEELDKEKHEYWEKKQQELLDQIDKANGSN